MYQVALTPTAHAISSSDVPPGEDDKAKDMDVCPLYPDYATVGHCADKCANPDDIRVGFTNIGVAICKHRKPEVTLPPQTVDFGGK